MATGHRIATEFLFAIAFCRELREAGAGSGGGEGWVGGWGERLRLGWGGRLRVGGGGRFREGAEKVYRRPLPRVWRVCRLAAIAQNHELQLTTRLHGGGVEVRFCRGAPREAPNGAATVVC